MENVWLNRLAAIVRLFFPARCAVCGAPLQTGEEGVCLRCDMEMPRTGYHLHKDNPVERLFWGKFPLERATSYLYYNKGDDFRRLLHALKYAGRQDLGELTGRFMAAELAPSGFFHGVDVIVPVPLHPKRQRSRGYNQSACIARGISAVTGIPVDTLSVVRHKPTETQTRKSTYERWENVAGIFQLTAPHSFTGKHVLLVDDVLTTGSTITACADAFKEVDGVRLSVLTLALAGW